MVNKLIMYNIMSSVIYVVALDSQCGRPMEVGCSLRNAKSTLANAYLKGITNCY